MQAHCIQEPQQTQQQKFTMAPSGFSPNERLLRKRLAARLRQRRCRERKRELIMSGIVAARTGGIVETNKSDSSISLEGTASADNSTGFSSSKSTPASSPSKVDTVYVNIQNIQPRAPPQGGYGWTYPVMPPIPTGKNNRAPQPPHQANFHHSQNQAPVPPHSNGYYVPPPSHHHHHHQQHYHQTGLVPMMYPHHPYMTHRPHHSHLYPPQKRGGNGSQGPPPYPVSAYGPPYAHAPPIPAPTDATNGTCQASVESGPGDVSRTVSRSPSDASMNSGKAAEAAVKAEKMQADVNETVSAIQEGASADEMINTSTCGSIKQKTSHKAKKGEKSSLMSTEKTAVAAMLAMKTSSDESDDGDDSISAVSSSNNNSNKRVSTRTTHTKLQDSTTSAQQQQQQQQQQQHALNSISLTTSA